MLAKASVEEVPLLPPPLPGYEVPEGKWGVGARVREGKAGADAAAKGKENGWAGIASRKSSPHIRGEWGQHMRQF